MTQEITIEEINELTDKDYEAAVKRFGGLELTEEEKKRCKKYDKIQRKLLASRKEFRDQLVREREARS